jgi:hypothetical protein
MRQKFIFLTAFILFNTLSNGYCEHFASVTWQGNYFHAIPNKPGVSKEYCKQHSPGIFIHTVNNALAHPIITENGIKLNQAKFHIKKENGVFLIQGSFQATGQTNNQKWEDTIHYYLYKLTDLGITRGVWSSKQCKGLYVGKVLENKSA